MEEINNPKVVLDALTEAPKKFKKFELGIMTISKYAWLERLNSPFINPNKEFSVDNIVPTVFVLASDKVTLKKFGSDIEALKAEAFEWADENLGIDEVPDVISAVVSVFTSINKAAPSAATESDSKKN